MTIMQVTVTHDIRMKERKIFYQSIPYQVFHNDLTSVCPIGKNVLYALNCFQVLKSIRKKKKCDLKYIFLLVTLHLNKIDLENDGLHFL